MVNKCSVTPKTLGSSNIKAGLSAVSKLEEFSHSKDIYFIVGGVAVQSYLPKEYRRPTADIDICLARPLNNRTEFKEFARPCIEYLLDHDFTLTYHKSSQNFKIIATERNSNDYMLIEFVRRNQEKYSQVSDRVERELENSRKKNINGLTITVTSPEDVALPKIVRGTNTLVRHPNLRESMSSLYNQENKNLQELLHHAIVERAKSDQPQADALLKEKSRLTADCYDIHCLSRFAGFNESYLTSSANDWNQTNIKEEWNFLMQMLNLPLN